MAQKKKRIWLRVLITLLVVILVIVAVLAATVGIVWYDELSTLSNFELLRDRDDDHEDGALYSMKVKGGYYFDEYLDEGGAKSDDELISFITSKITKGIISMNLSVDNISCSSFTAETEDGDRLFARNYDFSKTNTCIVFTAPTDGRHASVSTADLQFLGIDVDSNVNGLMNEITCLAAPYVPLDGMNDAGVSCGIYMTYQGAGDSAIPTNQNTDKPDITSTTMLRMILDYADSVDEAIELIQQYDLHDSANTSYHYMLADSTGKSAVIEWVNGTDATDSDGSARQLNVIYNDGSNYQVVTNFILTEGYYDDGVSTEDDMFGLDRYNQITSDLSGTNGVVSESTAMSILQTVGRRSWRVNDGGSGITVHSVVYNLTDLTATFVTNENYGDESATFTYCFDSANGTFIFS